LVIYSVLAGGRLGVQSAGAQPTPNQPPTSTQSTLSHSWRFSGEEQSVFG